MNTKNVESVEDDTTEENNIKSSLHDATPSWNGYNYQGLVGIYVCLKLIRQELKSTTFEELKVSTWAEDHTIEYEWLEDFAIKNNSKYISLHQVKHKESRRFSSHVDAINTIIDRKRKILNVIDFNKYLKIQGSSESINKEVSEILKQLKHIGCIDQNNVLMSDVHFDKIDFTCFKNHEKIKKFLLDYNSFSSNAFDDSKVFFHTSEGIDPPTKSLDQYSKFNSIHKEDFLKGKISLANSKIFFDFDCEIEYKLKMSDREILDEILHLIVDLLKMRGGNTDLNVISSKLYFLSIFNKVVEHIRYRHLAIRNKIYGDCLLYERTVTNIKLKDFLEILSKNFADKNEEYWNLYCKNEFLSIFNNYVEDLECCDDEGCREEIIFFIDNLKKYYDQELCVRKNENIINILKGISCDLMLNNCEDSFYHSLVSADKFNKVFFDFIRQIEKKENGLYFVCKNNKKYFPTGISVTDDPFRFKRDLERIQKNVFENLSSRAVDVGDSHYIVVGVDDKNKSKVDDFKLVSRNIIESEDSVNIISDREYRLFSLIGAVERLKSER